MWVLGAYFDEHLTWKEHVAKMTRLVAGLRFRRKRWNKNNLWIAITCQFFGTFYYGYKVCLGFHIRILLIRKLNSLHHKVLHIVKNICKKKKKRHELDMIGRAKPSKWMCYSSGTLVIKNMRDKFPFFLHEKLSESVY